MADNYDDVLAQLRGAGLVVSDLDLSGRIRRCRLEDDAETRGWYALRTWTRGSASGGMQHLIVGTYGIWRGTDNGATKIELPETATKLTPEERATQRKLHLEARRRAEAERKARAARAARRAESVWRRCDHAAPHPNEYLQRKGVQGHGLRYTAQGAAVVPICDGHGRVHGLQFLLSRSTQADRIRKLGRDKTYWPSGIQVQGHWYQIGTPGSLLLLAEGYATAATLHEATGLPVAVAFAANNLSPVARALKRRYPSTRILVCADDDAKTPGNPGISAASTAALDAGGAWMAPQFRDPVQVELRRQLGELDPQAHDYRAAAGAILRHAGQPLATDFNDLHATEGLALVRAQVEAKLEALGWTPAQMAARSSPPGGEGSRAHDFAFDMERLLSEITLIYGTDTVFDAARSRIIGLGPLRSAAGKGLVRQWLEHPGRRTVLPEQVGFDPAGRDEAIKCNLWSGWPTTPAAGRCERMLDLLQVLCDNETNATELREWVLRWLAYPLQHPGAKMQTALLVHGPEGTGKNTFFGAVRKIYGRYGTQFSQVELESNFNGWASSKLFAIGNEVVSRAELYHIQGRLKSMITEDTWQINEKMLPTREEANACNFVFFSNRVDIAKLDEGDRRYCVIYTPPALPPDYYADVAQEIANGGIAALHHYLLHLDLGDFNAHTKPPHTRAKTDLVNLSMDSTERFWRDWHQGLIEGLPCLPARTQDLYTAYRVWAAREGISKTPPKQTLLTVLGKKPGVNKRVERLKAERPDVPARTTVLFPAGQDEPADASQRRSDWVTEQVERFAHELQLYQEAQA